MSIRAAAAVAATLAACGGHASPTAPTASGDPNHIVIDRFSAAAGHLMVRTAGNGLPAPDQPIDLERPPFITQAFGPEGAVVRYYNFDIAPAAPAQLYRLTHAGVHRAIAGQDDLVDAIPGAPGYSDFWQINWVTVPDTFVAGSITSVAQLKALALPTESDGQILDCPVVPAGTVAHAGTGAISTQLAYRDAHITCLAFGDPLVADGANVPTSPIYVTFAKNPPAPDGGPPSGFRAEPAAGAAPAGLAQTHNVVFSVPGDSDYSPLWAVHIYDHAAFDRVHDANTASDAPLIEPHGPLVNCPIVYVAPKS